MKKLSESELAQLISTAIAMGMFVLGGLISGNWAFAGVTFVMGLVWWYGSRHGWTWITSLALVSFGLVSTYGTMAGIHPLMMLFALIAVLAAWDLDRYQRFLRKSPDDDDNGSGTRKHFVQLVAVCLLGLLIALMAIMIHLMVSFGLITILTLALVLILRQAVRLFRNTAL